jgi:hypothetical protein
MSFHPGISAHWDSVALRQLGHQARYAATGAAGLTALLYVLSCTVGPIKPGFGLAMGAVFAVAAISLFSSGQRLVWNLVALIDAGAIIGYFIVAPGRDPHFETWGIAIKVVQAALLVVLGYVIAGDRRKPARS